MIHPAVASASTEPPSFRWVPIQFRDVLLDGRWWPGSRDPGAGLPGLVRALEAVRGPVVRLLLSTVGWETRLRQIVVAGRAVSLGYFGDRPAATLTAIFAAGSTVTLLVEPADAAGPPDPAQQRWDGEGGRLAAPQ